MAKVSAPLLSFNARGTLADTMVFSQWRGVPYVRQRVIPSNPRTSSQQTTRTTFAFLREVWKVMPADARAPWDAFAEGRPFTGMNAFVGENLRVVRGDSDLADMIWSPGARGGFPAASVSATTGGSAGEIDVTITAPSLPTGWTVADTFAVAVQDADPATIVQGLVSVASDDTSPYEPNLTGLETSTDYSVGAFIQYTKPDGRSAYSVGVTNIVTSG